MRWRSREHAECSERRRSDSTLSWASSAFDRSGAGSDWSQRRTGIAVSIGTRFKGADIRIIRERRRAGDSVGAGWIVALEKPPRPEEARFMRQGQGAHVDSNGRPYGIGFSITARKVPSEPAAADCATPTASLCAAHTATTYLASSC